MTEKLRKVANFLIVNVLVALIVLVLKTIARKGWALIKKLRQRNNTQVATAEN